MKKLPAVPLQNAPKGYGEPGIRGRFQNASRRYLHIPMYAGSLFSICKFSNQRSWNTSEVMTVFFLMFFVYSWWLN